MLTKKDKEYFVLCIDLEKFTLPIEFGNNLNEKEQYRISHQGAEKIEYFLKEYNIKVTFFVTEDMALAYPDLIRRLSEQGHEIALHYDICDKTEKRLKICKERLESISGKEIIGFKTHKFTPFPNDILQRLGFLYNNSIHPTAVPGRYFNIFKNTKIYKENEIWNIPVSVTPVLRLPFSWIWFRNLGLGYVKFCTYGIYSNYNIINIYFHSWDFEDLAHYNMKRGLYFIFRNSGDRCIEDLSNYVQWLEKRGIIFLNFKDYLEQNAQINQAILYQNEL